MSFCGIICEFNPFHNGHEYIINQAKNITNSDIICLMSGNFVQRGEPAIQEKYTRASQAIAAGATAVLELPTVFACSNAENFAYGAIKIFKALDVQYLAFGIEDTKLETLKRIAEIKHENGESFVSAFKNEIENGTNYNSALKRAIANEFGNDKTIEDILKKPNNILAIEYLTAILKLNAKITPVAINRVDNGYYSNVENKQFLSASGIRNLIKFNENYAKFIPKYVKFDKFFDNLCNLKYENLILWNLRKSTPNKLEKHYDYTEGIEYRIKEMSDNFATLNEIISAVSTPRYRESRVKKLLLYPSLNITKNLASLAKTIKPAVKVLAISKNNKSLLNLTNKRKISLITTNKSYQNLSKQQKQIFNIDLNASNLYNTIISNINNNDLKKGTLFI